MMQKKMETITQREKNGSLTITKKNSEWKTKKKFNSQMNPESFTERDLKP